MGTLPPTRIAFADSNWLIATYYRVARTIGALTEWAEHPTIVVSEIVLAECRCAFWRKGDRIEALEADLRAKCFIESGESFASLAGSAKDVWKRYCPRFNLHTNDTLHVLAARNFGCAYFLRHESLSRPDREG